MIATKVELLRAIGLLLASEASIIVLSEADREFIARVLQHEET